MIRVVWLPWAWIFGVFQGENQGLAVGVKSVVSFFGGGELLCGVSLSATKFGDRSLGYA